MQRMSALYRKAPFTLIKTSNLQLDSVNPNIIRRFLFYTNRAKTSISPMIVRKSIDFFNASHPLRCEEIRVTPNATQGELTEVDDDDELCPVDCVKEFKTDDELFSILAKAKENGSLVVVDFYRTACGSCKYIEKGFTKLCKGSGDQGAAVIFLKHNVIDEYDEQSEVAERLKIRAVPLFHFYKDGVMMESFATRDKARIDAAILKYTSENS